jgi:uncharacterized RDD family membrane protein YckC
LNNSVLPAGYRLHEPAISTIEFATREQRCINFIIDNLVMRFTLAYGTGIIFAWVLNTFFPAFALLVLHEDQLIPFLVVTYMVSRVNYAIYYSISEKCFRGYTVGKWLTHTRAIRKDGKELSTINAIHRSFARFLPFEFLSGFGLQPWHDHWTRTIVIKAKR